MNNQDLDHGLISTGVVKKPFDSCLKGCGYLMMFVMLALTMDATIYLMLRYNTGVMA
jgi:hypothetical protein